MDAVTLAYSKKTCGEDIKRDESRHEPVTGKRAQGKSTKSDIIA